MSANNDILEEFNKIINIVDEKYNRPDRDVFVKCCLKLVYTDGITIRDIKDVFALAYDIAWYRDRNVKEDMEDIIYRATDYITEENVTVKTVIEDLTEKYGHVFNSGSGAGFRHIGLNYC